MHRSIARRAALVVVGLLGSGACRPGGHEHEPHHPHQQHAGLGHAQRPGRDRSRQRPAHVLGLSEHAQLQGARCRHRGGHEPGERRLRQVPDARPVPRPLRADRRRRGRGPRLPEQSGFAVSADRPDNNRWVKASGTTAQVEQAFKTQLRTYQHRGKTLQAPNGDLSIARSISSRIAGIAGLDGSDRLMRPDTADAPPVARRSSTRRRARRRGARRPPSTTRATRRSRPRTARRPARTRRAATRPTSCRAPTAPRQPSPAASTAAARRWRSSTPSRRRRSSRTPTSTRRPTASRPVDFSQIKPEDRSNDPIGGTDRLRRAGLVRRGDARRRGRARDGARRARALRGRRRLPRRVAHRRGQQDRRRQPGPDRLELLRQPR